MTAGGGARIVPGRTVTRNQAAIAAGPVSVSVIISSWNHGPYVGDTVVAVSEQLVDNVELVIVDNGSDDDTPQILCHLLDEVTIPMTVVRLDCNVGPAAGRNAGLDHARGAFVAFTDSDCVPTREWLQRALKAFRTPDVGIVQGRTTCASEAPPFFSHFIETPAYDGSYSTSNVVYRASAIARHRFDPGCSGWEDTDLGWRVRAEGWHTEFCPAATVCHQAVPQSPMEWLLTPRRLATYTEKVRSFPAFREVLYLGTWVDPIHARFQLAVAGLVFVRRRPVVTGMAALPYAATFVLRRGLGGRAPLIKAALHLARDAVGTVVLVAASLRRRTVVL